jgi:hypothetical protein
MPSNDMTSLCAANSDCCSGSCNLQTGICN